MSRHWMAVVMGALLVGVLVGEVVRARPDHSAQAADVTRRVTVPAAFFHPNDEGLDYWNNGNYVEMQSGQGIFTAPVVFPCLSSVTVERIILSVKDQNSGGIANACVTLYRTKPNKGIENKMASVCSSGAQPGIINYTDDTVDYPEVWPSHGPYLWLELYGTNIEVYGVRIEYKRNV
jgi:hypothetical protein